MKCKLVDTKDKDYVEIVGRLGKDLLADGTAEEVYFHLDEVFVALNDLTGDSYLSDMVSELNPLGYNIHKAASSEVGVSLAELAAFATIELRIRLLAEFLSGTYSSCVLRERQDTKVRYEVDSEGIKISTIFASIESNKDKLQLDDYGVSQTSLEQVFNMHAAEAEKLKFGTDDF